MGRAPAPGGDSLTLGREALRAIALGILIAACQPAAPPSSTATVTADPSPSGSATRSAGPSPTASTATSTPLPSGAAAPACVEGWRGLDPADPLALEATALILGQMGVDGELVAEEIRVFDGPDVPWILEPHFDTVRRWYVKAALAADPAFRGRWLVEHREPGREGVAAVAPYDSTGYASPDWRGFVGDGAPREVPGLPGTWPGLEYDFVTGQGDTGNRGLPAEVEGCLAGT